jgi:hypothetical protein
MASRDPEIDLQALAYLVTVMIHRLHETDPTWSISREGDSPELQSRS